MFRFGSLADMATRPPHVRFTPKADIHQCDKHVRFVPIADTDKTASFCFESDKTLSVSTDVAQQTCFFGSIAVGMRPH